MAVRPFRKERTLRRRGGAGRGRLIKCTRAGLISARPIFWGREEKRPRPSVLPNGQNLDAGAIYLPRADKKKWGPRRGLPRWGGRTSRRPGEGHRGRQFARAELISARPIFCGRMQLSCAVGAAFTAARRTLYSNQLLTDGTEGRPGWCGRDCFHPRRRSSGSPWRSWRDTGGRYADGCN